MVCRVCYQYSEVFFAGLTIDNELTFMQSGTGPFRLCSRISIAFEDEQVQRRGRRPARGSTLTLLLAPFFNSPGLCFIVAAGSDLALKVLSPC